MSTATNLSPTTTFTSRQRVILLVLLGAGFLVSVDFSIFNVALPETGAGIGMQLKDWPWIASAYALPSAGLALLFGRLADRVGRRRLFMASMLLLAAASLLGGLAADPATVLAARALQGTATAMALPTALALLTTTFAEGRLRERALGLNGALLSGGFTLGALVGGTFVSLLSWRAAFLLNVPVAIAILACTPLVIEDSRPPVRPALDVAGAATVSVGLVGVVYAVVEKSVVAAIAGAALLVAFWLVERRSPAPLAPISVLSRRTVTWANVAGFTVFTMETGMIFLMTLYLQRILGLSPFITGLVFGIPGLAAVAAGVIAGRLLGRFGPARILPVAMCVQGTAIIPLVFLGQSRATIAVVVPTLLIGFFGHVCSIVGYTVTGTSGLTNDDQGLATGLATMTQQVAIAVGIPILSTVAATQSVELTGIHVALTVDVAVTLVSSMLVMLGLRARKDQDL
ncbi:MFS transporter [Kribbella pratensis]|uniref:MFS family arabinose efflux permease n=1 Tax=Kribbella pratensis TaxID=2512112 RepID=A0A4R8C3U3_9ACTN|nr:MFS transporter [Kribbella pratensis]TDW69771.1 putative MFS family arabinose efflux permease [Kribbella pratensis]